MKTYHNAGWQDFELTDWLLILDAHSEPSQTFKMEIFAKTVKK